MNAKETVLESQEDFGKLLVENGKALLVEVSSFLWIQRTAGLIEKRIELLVAVAGSVVIPGLELYGFFVAVSFFMLVSIFIALSIFMVVSAAGAGAIAGAAAVSSGVSSFVLHAARASTAATRARRFIYILLVGG